MCGIITTDEIDFSSLSCAHLDVEETEREPPPTPDVTIMFNGAYPFVQSWGIRGHVVAFGEALVDAISKNIVDAFRHQ